MNTLFTEFNLRYAIPVVIAAAYVLAIIIIRWNLIAVPLRHHLRVAIESGRSRLHVEGSGKEESVAYKEVENLLDQASAQLNIINILDMTFWSRGREMNGWRRVHEAGRLMAGVFSPEMVNARLEGAVHELKSINSQETSELASNIVAELKSPAGDKLERRQALLKGALAQVYDKRDQNYAFLDTWDNEAMWMVTVGLFLITVLACLVGNGELFLAGAAGGFLARLTHLIKVKVGSTDYGLYWDPLFMSPVLGALTGWAGVLLVVFIANEEFGILGPVFRAISWNEPQHPYTLALGFLFGLSERLFGDLVSGAKLQVIGANSEADKEHGAKMT